LRNPRASAQGGAKLGFAVGAARGILPVRPAQAMSPRLAVLVSAASLLAACSPSGAEKFKAEVLAADKAFSEASRQQGIQAAFLGVIAPEGKLLAETRPGAAGVRTLFMQLPPTATLTWEAAFVDVSSSGDLGYTWGRYTLTLPSVAKGKLPSVQMGTYVTVWRRQPSGAWKVVLDGGNPDRHY
jgi:ketosteroid isomerase-like protein